MNITSADLLNSIDPDELAGVATPKPHRPVDVDLLRLTILGSARTDYDSADTDIADKALTAIDDAVNRANSVIESMLAKYLPIDTPTPMLKGIAVDLARYYLHDVRASAEIEKRHDAAMSLLEKMAVGKIVIGTDNTETGGTPETNVDLDNDPVMTSSNLSGFISTWP